MILNVQNQNPEAEDCNMYMLEDQCKDQVFL